MSRAISPFADDLTVSGTSLELRKAVDHFVTRELLQSMETEYLGGADPTDLPPLLIQVGEDEILFDATRIRDATRAARVDTTFSPGGTNAEG